MNKFIYFLKQDHIVAQTVLVADEARNIFVNECKYELDDKVNVVSIAYRIHKHLYTKENVYYCVYNIKVALESFSNAFLKNFQEDL